MFIFVFFLPINVQAVSLQQNDKINEYMTWLDTSGLYNTIPQHTANDLSKMEMDEISPENIKNFSFSKLVETIISYFTSGIRDLKHIIAILGTVCIFQILISVTDSSDEVKNVCKFAVSAIVICLLGSSFRNFSYEAFDVVRESTNFMYTFVPLYCTASASCGGIVSANAFSVFMLLVCEVVNDSMSRFFIPLCGIFMTLFLSGIMASSDLICRVSGILKKALIILLGSAVGVVAFLLSITNHMAVSADSITLKTASFLTGAFVPIIGSAIKDAVGSMQGCMYIIKAAVGSFGIIAGILIFLPIIIKIVVYKAVLSIFSGIFSSSENKSIENILSAFSQSATIILAVLFSICFLMVISTGIMLSFGYGG